MLIYPTIRGAEYYNKLKLEHLPHIHSHKYTHSLTLIKQAMSLLLNKANPAMVQWTTIKLLLLQITCHKPGWLPGRQLASAGIIVFDCGDRRRLDRLFLLCPLSVQLLPEPTRLC